MGGTSREQMSDAFGAYVRSQRQLARLTLRQAAEMASISNPYLSQIEHGLSLPSIAVIRALADALSVSAETLLLRAAGIMSPTTGERTSHTEDAIRHDSRLDDGQKQALLAVLASFVRSSAMQSPADGAAAAHPVQPAGPRAADDPAKSGAAVMDAAGLGAAVTSEAAEPSSPAGSAGEAGRPSGIRGSAPRRTSGRPATAGAVNSRRRRKDHD